MAETCEGVKGAATEAFLLQPGGRGVCRNGCATEGATGDGKGKRSFMGILMQPGAWGVTCEKRWLRLCAEERGAGGRLVRCVSDLAPQRHAC